MTAFRDTEAAETFIASAASRETSTEIMQAIVFFARDLAEAETLWNGDGFGTICNPSDLWEHVTGNGLRDASDYFWGSEGNRWWATLSVAPDGRGGPLEMTIKIGTRVEAGNGEDHDTGRVVECIGADETHPMACPGNVYVAWDSGVRTWTPVGDLTAIRHG